MIARVGCTPIVADAGSAIVQQSYRIAQIDEGGNEVHVSEAVTVRNDLSVPGNCNHVHWSGDGGMYRVYRNVSGIFETIHETTDSHFIDRGSI